MSKPNSYSNVQKRGANPLDLLEEISQQSKVVTHDYAWVNAKIDEHKLTLNALKWLVSPLTTYKAFPTSAATKMYNEMLEEGYIFPLAGADLSLFEEIYAVRKEGSVASRDTLSKIEIANKIEYFSGPTKLSPQEVAPILSVSPLYEEGQYYKVKSVAKDGSYVHEIVPEDTAEEEDEKKVHYFSTTLPRHEIGAPITSVQIVTDESEFIVTHGLNNKQIKRPYDTYLAAQLSFFVTYKEGLWIPRVLKDLSSECFSEQCRNVALFFNKVGIEAQITGGKWADYESILSYLRLVPSKDYKRICERLTQMCFNMQAKNIQIDDHFWSKVINSDLLVKNAVQKEKAGLTRTSQMNFSFHYSQMMSAPMTEFSQNQGFLPGQSDSSVNNMLLLFLGLVLSDYEEKLDVQNVKTQAMIEDFNEGRPEAEQIKMSVDGSGTRAFALNVTAVSEGQSGKILAKLYDSKQDAFVIGHIPPHLIRKETAVYLVGPIRPDMVFIYDLKSSYALHFYQMGNMKIRHICPNNLLNLYKTARKAAVFRSVFPVTNIGNFTIHALRKKQKKLLPTFEPMDLEYALQSQEMIDYEMADAKVVMTSTTQATTNSTKKSVKSVKAVSPPEKESLKDEDETPVVKKEVRKPKAKEKEKVEPEEDPDDEIVNGCSF